MKKQRNITVIPSVFGHWKVYSDHCGRRVYGITTDSVLIDRYNELREHRDRGIISIEEKLHRIAKNK